MSACRPSKSGSSVQQVPRILAPLLDSGLLQPPVYEVCTTHSPFFVPFWMPICPCDRLQAMGVMMDHCVSTCSPSSSRPGPAAGNLHKCYHVQAAKRSRSGPRASGSSREHTLPLHRPARARGLQLRRGLLSEPCGSQSKPGLSTISLQRSPIPSADVVSGHH